MTGDPAFGPTRGVERPRALGLAGLLAVPTLVGVVLAWGLEAPQQNLERITAAVVNDDDPVTIDGQTVPLGRELAGGLIGGSAGAGAPDDPTASPTPSADTSATPSPSATSTAGATSTPTPSATGTPTPSVAPGATPTSSQGPSATPSTSSPTPGATASPAAGPTTSPASAQPDFTWILTNDDDAAAGLQDGTYAAVLTIPPDFSTRATSISGAADDAQRATIHVQVAPTVAALDQALTEAVVQAAVTTLNETLTERYLTNVYDGFNQINSSVAQAADGAEQLAQGTDSLSSGAGQLSSGAEDLASGLDSLATGADGVASGADQLATGLDSLASGAGSLSAGLDELDDSVQSLPSDTQELAGGSAQVAAALDAASSALDDATQDTAAVVETICDDTDREQLCDRATAALEQLETADDDLSQLATGADQVAEGNAQLADGMPSLVDGIDSSADGAAEIADGADSSASGGASVSDGASEVASGAAQSDAGAQQLAQGLDEAATEIPTYTDDDITTLSTVVTTPVTANVDTPVRGSRTVPLVAVVALWVGAIVIALAHPAVARSRLLTARSSTSLALWTTGRVAAIGAAQGLAVGLVLLPFVDTQASLVIHLGSSVVVGTIFAVVNTGLAAMFGGFGRLLAALVAVVVLVVGTASTAPPTLEAVAALLPTAPAQTLLLAGIGVGTGWGALLVLVLWAALGFALTVGGVALHRRGESLLAWEDA